MMKTRFRDFWTYVIITAVTVVIWGWTASATRDERTIAMPVNIRVTGPDQWLVDRSNVSVAIEAEGSQLAIRKAQAIDALTIDVVGESGEKAVPLANLIREHPLIQETGIVVSSTEPVEVRLKLERLVRADAVVEKKISGVRATLDVTPQEVEVWLPESVRNRRSGPVSVELGIIPGLADLAPDTPHTLNGVQVQLPRELSHPDARIRPDKVDLRITIQSQDKDLKLTAPVRVQIAGPPEDSEATVIDPVWLRDVTIHGSRELLRRVEDGEAIVVAVLHLKSTEREARIPSKRISYFVALDKDTGVGAIVEARVGPDEDPRPEIALTIAEE